MKSYLVAYNTSPLTTKSAIIKLRDSYSLSADKDLKELKLRVCKQAHVKEEEIAVEVPLGGFGCDCDVHIEEQDHMMPEKLVIIAVSKLDD